MERSKPLFYGTSKLVPNVQELAKQAIDASPPPRYIRSDIDPPIISNPNMAVTLPVIDMDKLLGGDYMELELNRFHSACKDWGFFQLVNHGVNYTLLDSTKLEIQEFFNLPLQEKKRFWQKENEIEGFGQAFVLSDEQKLDWGDMFFMTTSPMKARKPHLLPKLPLPFRNTIDAYSLEMRILAMKIIRIVGKALSMEVEEITDLFQEGTQLMRMNYYPPCPQPEKVIGFTPHSDSVGLTILLQVNDMEGLQIKKEGTWIPVKPLPNAFIINIGDILEIITNGAYRSVEHRATVNKVKERISIATFHDPRYDAAIGPASSLVTAHTPALYRKIKMKDYMKGLFSRRPEGKAYIDAMKLKTGKGTIL